LVTLVDRPVHGPLHLDRLSTRNLPDRKLGTQRLRDGKEENRGGEDQKSRRRLARADMPQTAGAVGADP